MNHKLGICVPYRDRKEHLDQLLPHLTKYLNSRGINHKFYIGHQIDDKLFNRGAMKNIAAKYAFDDGCDYIAWHDVDMLPFDGCDYGYPTKHPIHIATQLSKYNYGMGYDQYFGGVVLFTKEQAEKVNGYSNQYWDWGQEDDDLFWRCQYEGYTNSKIIKNHRNRIVANFNGENSYLSLPTTKLISQSLSNDHTISILFNPQQQINKFPIWLVGDRNKKFVEYPILRKEGSWGWGLSFNNSRAITMTVHDKFNQLYYNWGKRFENLWTWVTMSYCKKEKNIYFYINGELTSQMDGIKQNKPFPILYDLKNHNLDSPFLVGGCNHSNVNYKGQIAEIKIHNRCTKTDTLKNEDLILHYDFTKGLIDNINGTEGQNNNVQFTTEDIDIIDNILPFRKEGRMLCLPHPDQGFVNGTWARGASTAMNEKRLVRKMQQREIDYKNDGLNTLKYELVNTVMYTDNCMIINLKL